MAESYNIYLDESCHLENDGIPVMTLGAIWCLSDKCEEVSRRLRDLKRTHCIRENVEIKWTRVSPAKVAFYQAVLDYFLDDDDLHFRGVVIPDKTLLDHNRHRQTHDDWYYKMCFRLLEPLVVPSQKHFIYLDIKDTRSETKRKKLEEVLRSAKLDGTGDIIRRVQQIRSHESLLMQLADLLIGTVTAANRGITSSPAKRKLIERVRERTSFSLTRSTWLREDKINLLHWRATEGGGR